MSVVFLVIMVEWLLAVESYRMKMTDRSCIVICHTLWKKCHFFQYLVMEQRNKWNKKTKICDCKSTGRNIV